MMKSLTKTFPVLLFLTAGSLAASGQNTLFVNNIQTLLAYSADIQGEIELSAECTANAYWFYMEEKVQLEDWMIEQSSWRDASAQTLETDIRVEPEPEIETAPWMIQPFSSDGQETWEFLVVPEEKPLEVRKWMICCTDWNLKTLPGSGLKSPVITLE
jgi:hypothetical protein